MLPTPLGADSDAGVGARPAGCPAAAPDENGACGAEGLLCEYGDDFDPLCNTLRVCSGGRWASPIFPGAGGAKCPTVLPPPAPNPSDCAATRDAVPVGSACSSTSACVYGGASCACGAWCPSFPVGQPDCNADAGVTMNCCDRSKTAWYCFDGPSLCARPRPRVGTACSPEGAECAVAGPTECGQPRLQCRMGAWTMESDSCPISTARAKRDVVYLDDADAERLRAALLAIPISTWRYREGDDARHLGFVIEDLPPGSPAVAPARDRVDLYGYVTMAVATLQRQERELAELRAKLARLERRRCR